MKIVKKFTLSSYEALAFGIGHRVDGNPPKNPSFMESGLTSMLAYFKELPTGTKIIVTMEKEGGSRE